MTQSNLVSAAASVNRAGAPCYVPDAKTKYLLQMLGGFFGHNAYYGAALALDAEFLQTVRDVAALDPEFVLRGAAYARQVFGMRQGPRVGLIEAASLEACKPFVRKWTPEIVRRADEFRGAVTLWNTYKGDVGAGPNKKSDEARVKAAFPHALKKGLAAAFERFEEYHLAKYDGRKEGEATFKDALCVVRPYPATPERAALQRYLMKGVVDQPALTPRLAARQAFFKETEFSDRTYGLGLAAGVGWREMTSHFGSTTAVWDAIEFPIMAGVRNLRNLLQKGANHSLDRVLARLLDEESVRRSKLFPFQFFSAHRVVSALPEETPRKAEVLAALETALYLSVNNVPGLDGVTAVLVDLSGSMETKVSEKSTVSLKDIGCLSGAMASVLAKESVCIGFACEVEQYVPRQGASILERQQEFAGLEIGCSTNAYMAVELLQKLGVRVDRALLFSDMQCYGGDSSYYAPSLKVAWDRYRKAVAPEAKLYSIDMARYAQPQFPLDDPGVATMVGFSEQVFHLIAAFERDPQTLVARVMGWTPRALRDEMVFEEEESEEATA